MEQGNETRRVATLKDVALSAGVSVATASKAINGRQEVKASTRARVLRAAQDLSFRSARSRRESLLGRAGSVGVLTFDLGRKSSIRLLMGAEDALSSEQTTVHLCDARGDVIREKHHLRSLLSRQLDGILVIGGRPNPRPTLGPGLPVPIVYLYAPSLDPADLSVVNDNIEGGKLAVEHLLAQGRHRIAHVTGDFAQAAAHERADGVERALVAAGHRLAGDRVISGRWDESWGRGATRMLLDQGTEFDAVVAGSDQIARGVLDAVHEHNLDVPRDVAIIGFDNFDLLVANARPQLTSVDLRLEELSALAVRHLYGRIDGHTDAGLVKLSSRVVQRGSTARLN